MDELCEHTLKLFGDVFESIIGAVFLDSEDLGLTRRVLFGLLDPYVKVYATKLDEMQEHSRTQLLELWNSTLFRKYFKCSHFTNQSGADIEYVGYLEEISNPAARINLYSVRYSKEEKSKVRLFYKNYLHNVRCLIDYLLLFDWSSLD